MHGHTKSSEAEPGFAPPKVTAVSRGAPRRAERERGAGAPSCCTAVLGGGPWIGARAGQPRPCSLLTGRMQLACDGHELVGVAGVEQDLYPDRQHHKMIRVEQLVV